MRRSRAVGNFRAPIIGSVPNHCMGGNIEKSKICAPIENAARSTESILGVIANVQKMPEPEDDSGGRLDSEVVACLPPPSVLKENVATNQPSPAETCSNKRIFTVVYGKPSKKKHKTWEGDGVLEVGEKSLILKDPEGSVLGRGSGKKNAELEEGSRLFVGSKEVEIIDKIVSATDGTSVKRPTQDTPPPAKRARVSSGGLTKFQAPVLPTYTPLIMPQPDLDHQLLQETMRQSSTPSNSGGNFRTPIIGSVSNHCRGGNIEKSTICAPIENAVRSTESILGVIANVQKMPEPEDESGRSLESEVIACLPAPSVLKENIATNQPSPAESCSNKRVFTVVYGKPSKKKHKTWEGDGVLEVGEKSLILKDPEGSVLGRGSGKKNAELEEGSRLFVGSKEVEIIDRIVSATDGASVKRPTQDTPPPTKRACVSSSGVTKSQAPVLPTYTPLIMPQPDLDHQWRFNPSGAAIQSVAVDPSLVKVLRPHQREGVTFLFRCVTGMRDPDHLGVILADEMGLGKTLQCITLIWTMLRHSLYGNSSLARKVLVVTPSSLTRNWLQEFLRWLGKQRICIYVVDQKNKAKDFHNHPNIPVMIISYEMFVRNYDDVAAVPFDLIVCDEGHRLKNNSVRASTLLNQLPCKRRVLLSGTPVQNDLQEFFTLVDFVNPGILGTYSEFRKNYEEAIVASRQQGAPVKVKTLGQVKAQELSRFTTGFVLRRTQEILDSYLPSKHEAVIFCKPSPLQMEMFEAAIRMWEEGRAVSHLAVIMALKKICNHPALLRDNDNDKENDSLYEFLNQELSRLGGDKVMIEDASKLTVVKSLLQSASSSGDKIVLVSYFTQTLDLFSALCDQCGYRYCRLDGNIPVSRRVDLVNEFNSNHSSYSVFLLSARAGGVGLNLTGASRLVLYDSDWNPASDLQAMARVWRDGQRKHVHIYRLLTTGSIEEKVFQRQLSKAGLNEAVVDPTHTSAVRLSDEELKDLFTVSEETDCLTHAALPCDCEGEGEVPHPVVPQTDTRKCQLMATQGQGNSLRMNQLFQWEHYRQPVSTDLLQTLGLEDVADLITFIFRNVLEHSLPVSPP